MNGRKVRLGTARVIAGALIVAMLSLGGVDASGADPSTKVLVAVFDDFSSGSIQFEVEGIPSEVEADNYKVTFANGSIGPHVLIEFKIPDGWTSEQLLAALDSEEPPEGAFFVNAVFAKPGQQHQKQYDLTLPGTYGYFCPIPTPAGVPHFDLGFVGVFEVT